VTINERNTIYETTDILRALGGNNGFSNLQPRIKKMLLVYANRLKDIADRDAQFGKDLQVEEFEGETVYEN
jgi:hypothetical protein